MAVGEQFYSKWKSLTYGLRTTIANFVAPDGVIPVGQSWWQMGNNAPIWLDINNLWQVYTDVPHLNMVINKKAELLSLGRIRLRNIKTQKEILEDDVLTLVRKPNPLQNKSEFITMYSTYRDVWGNLPMFKNYGVIPNQQNGFSRLPGQLWNLPSVLIQVKPTGKLFRQTTIEGIIEYYELRLNNEIIRFTPIEILFKNDNIGADYLTSQSKIVGIKLPLSNIYATMETMNVLTKERGAFGIISTGGTKDSSGVLPMGQKEKKRVEEQYDKNYGIQRGKRRNIITGASVTYTPMSYPIKDMNLDIEVEQDFGIICGTYGIDRDIFPSTKGATFENKKQAYVQTIQNTIQADGDDLMETWTDDFGLRDRGVELFMTFDHLPVMQSDQVSKSTALKNTVDALNAAFQAGGIKPEVYQKEMEKLFLGQ